MFLSGFSFLDIYYDYMAKVLGDINRGLMMVSLIILFSTILGRCFFYKLAIYVKAAKYMAHMPRRSTVDKKKLISSQSEREMKNFT